MTLPLNESGMPAFEHDRRIGERRTMDLGLSPVDSLERDWRTGFDRRAASLGKMAAENGLSEDFFDVSTTVDKVETLMWPSQEAENVPETDVLSSNEEGGSGSENNVYSLDLMREWLTQYYGAVPHKLLLLPSPSEAEVIPFPSLSSPEKSTGFMQKFRARFQPRYKSSFTPRAATLKDVDALVNVDIRAFSSVYTEEERSSAVFQQQLREKFTGRIDKHGGDWMQVLEKDGEIHGFMNVCPTSKSPDEFESWEKTTDNGTLETTYDPNGKNLYIVSLSMLPTGSAEQGQNMLFANQIGKMIEEGYEQAYFESRMPGLRTWVRAQCRVQGESFGDLTDVQKQDYAERYFNLTKEINGKKVPHDRLLRMYSGAGCKLKRVVNDAYEDVPSMNFGVMCVYDNPLPRLLRQNRLVSKGVGKLVRTASKSHWLMKKVFKD